ncbi:hypothetical protein [Aestuariimicrobium ganziense]|uniref:hypothetical protein n=1 Tax=Aestuariimicrobium ganziense TaxID=2773677 RepID=UPI0019430C6B|nr:hypothetical protein [Aestuariimicrobium ganziense]
MTPSGQLTTFLAAIGASNPDPRILEVVTLVGPKRKKQKGIDGGEFWTFADKGADLSFDAEGTLTTVFLRPYDTDEYGVEYTAYPDFGELVEGLGDMPSRVDVREVFGDPDDTADNVVLHQVGGRWLRFEFDDEDDVILLTLMHEVPR